MVLCCLYMLLLMPLNLVSCFDLSVKLSLHNKIQIYGGLSLRPPKSLLKRSNYP